MATFETLVNEVLDEYGIGGGGPLVVQSGQTEAVDGQSGQIGRVVRWVREANSYVNNLWIDWRFLWREWEGTLAADSQAPTLPTVSADGYVFKHMDRSSFWLDKNKSTHNQLVYRDYDLFRVEEVGVLSTGTPGFITEKPNGTLRVNRPADKAYTFHCSGWKVPTVLTADDDEPDIPAQFHRIIKMRAVIFYANKEDAPEILEGAEAEYIDLLDKLQSSELESFRYERMSTADLELTIDVPGEESLGVTR